MEFVLTWANGSCGRVAVPDPELIAFLEGYWQRASAKALADADQARKGIVSVALAEKL